MQIWDADGLCCMACRGTLWRAKAHAQGPALHGGVCNCCVCGAGAAGHWRYADADGIHMVGQAASVLYMVCSGT